jgi:hypothetical protein
MKGRDSSDSSFYPDSKAGCSPISVENKVVDEWNVDEMQDVVALLKKCLGYITNWFVHLN